MTSVALGVALAEGPVVVRRRVAEVRAGGGQQLRGKRVVGLVGCNAVANPAMVRLHAVGPEVARELALDPQQVAPLECLEVGVFVAFQQGVDELCQAAACGDGPVDAAYEAIRLATGQMPKVDKYSIRAVTGGKEALGEASVTITDDGHKYMGRGVSTDIIEASAKAYVDAINRMVAIKKRGEDDEIKAEI